MPSSHTIIFAFIILFSYTTPLLVVLFACCCLLLRGACCVLCVARFARVVTAGAWRCKRIRAGNECSATGNVSPLIFVGLQVYPPFYSCTRHTNVCRVHHVACQLLWFHASMWVQLYDLVPRSWNHFLSSWFLRPIGGRDGDDDSSFSTLLALDGTVVPWFQGSRGIIVKRLAPFFSGTHGFT